MFVPYAFLGIGTIIYLMWLIEQDLIISKRDHHRTAVAIRFPSHGTGRPGLKLQTATKLPSADLGTI